MHAGLNRAGLHKLSVGRQEAKCVADELNAIGPLPDSTKARVALVYDYEASWITRIQPQGTDYHVVEIMCRWYEAAHQLGLDVDFAPPSAQIDEYDLVLVPRMPDISDAATREFKNAKGILIWKIHFCDSFRRPLMVAT